MRDDDVRKKDYLQRRIEPISPKATGSIDDFLRRLGGCSFQGRALSRCLDVLEAMTTDDGCLLVMTLSGAMVPGGMEQTIVELIEEGVIDLLVTTGANVSHSMVNHADEENQGHFVGAPSADDADLFRHAINRIYDTFLPEEGYHKGEMLLEALLREHFDESGIDPTTPWRVTPSELFGIVGSGLEKLGRHGLLASAHRCGIPIYCGATSDSEFALNIVKFNERYGWQIIIDELADVNHFAGRLLKSERSGTFIIGGGVPRNWAQQAWPLLEMSGETDRQGYDRTVRIYTDSPAWGGLSGCTVSESISWGKYTADSVAAEVKCDATIAMPLLVAGLFERMGLRGPDAA